MDVQISCPHVGFWHPPAAATAADGIRCHCCISWRTDLKLSTALHGTERLTGNADLKAARMFEAKRQKRGGKPISRISILNVLRSRVEYFRFWVFDNTQPTGQLREIFSHDESHSVFKGFSPVLAMPPSASLQHGGKCMAPTLSRSGFITTQEERMAGLRLQWRTCCS